MATNRHTEQEWQFAARELDAARSWLAAQPRESSERRFSPRPTLKLQDTYYDSPDWMIFRAGFALRVRHAREADSDGAGETEITLKSLQNGHNGLARRTEISEIINAPLEEILLRTEGIGGRIRELVGPRSLTPLFHARTRRERQHLLEAESELPLAEVDLDETSIETPSGKSHELRRVEVECINAEPEALSPLVERLRDAAQLEPVEVSKFRAGLVAAGLDPSRAQSTGGTEITAAQPFALAQLALLRRLFESLASKEAEVRAGSVTGLHEMRVAARRVEVLLRSFRGYGPTWAVASRGRIRTLIKALGAVRDWDVQIAFLDAALESRDAEQRGAFHPIRERLFALQAKARAALLRTLDSPGVQNWLSDWRQRLSENTPGSARAQRAHTAVVARDLIREAARALRKRARHIDAKSTAEQLHEVRIRAKRLRYTVDAFGSLYGKPAEEYVAALSKLQTVLGECHDATVRESRFTEIVTRGPRLPPSTSFMAGRLIESDARALETCRGKFEKAWRRVRRRRWRELSAAMKNAASMHVAPAADAPA